MREKLLTDEQIISRTEAAIICHTSKRFFFGRWEEYYCLNIRSVETTKGLQLSLYDLMEILYPRVTKPAEVSALCLQAVGILQWLKHDRKRNGGTQS